MISLLGCSSPDPTEIGISGDRLTACPSRPNCVASDAEDVDHRIEPLRFEGDPTAVWQTLQEIITGLPRTEIVTVEDRYLHAEVKSSVFGFVDDVEFYLRPEDGLIAVRSAARVGYSDLGVNAARIETIRADLKARGLLA